jgi:hypothetical protein
VARWRTPLQAAAAAALLTAGAFAPWLTLYAGLQSFPGTTGTYGRLLLGAGGVLVLVAVAAAVRPADRWRWATGVIGAAALYPAVRAVLGLRSISELDGLLVAAPGAGPWLALAGGAIAFSALFLRPAAQHVDAPTDGTKVAPPVTA